MFPYVSMTLCSTQLSIGTTLFSVSFVCQFLPFFSLRVLYFLPRCNLAESFKEGCCSERAVLPTLMINIMYRVINNMSSILSSTQNWNKTGPCLHILSGFSTKKSTVFNVIHRQSRRKSKYRSSRREILSPPIQKQISLLKILPQLITRNLKAWRKMSLVVIFLKTVVFTLLHNMIKLLPIN